MSRRLAILLGMLVAATSCAHERAMPPLKGDVEVGPGLISVAPVVSRPAAAAPWEPSIMYPTFEAVPPVAPRGSVASEGPIRAAAWLWFRAYQATFSRVDGSTCRFRPTCSGFGIEAVREHGLLGLPMTFGRLHRSHAGARHYPMLDPPFLEDPIANYGFTMRRPRLDDFASYDDEAHAWYQHVRAVRRLR